MYRILLIGIVVSGLTVAAIAVSPSGYFQQRLLESQRQGSCTELPLFGVNTHRRRNPDDVNVKLVKELGARIVRLDVPWIDVERGGKYDFSPFDHIVHELRESGVTTVLALVYGHPDHSDGFAENGFPLPPKSDEQRAAYARFVVAAAARYHGSDIVYEISNEPNLAVFWPPAPDPQAYGALLADAAKALRQADPAATIISGGLANEGDPPGFIHVLAQSGSLDDLDGITFHPYRQDGPENSLYDIGEFEAKGARPKPLPLWITEWGYSEAWLARQAPNHIRRQSAIMIARLMLTSALAKAKAALIYDLIDDGTNQNDQESSFGLYDSSFEPKPAAAAFRTLADLMSHCSGYQFTVDSMRDIITARLAFADALFYIVWTYSTGNDVQICLAAPNSTLVEETDLFGNHFIPERCGGTSNIGLKVSDETGPVILRIPLASTK
jgi:hypothetical protein